MSNDVELTVSVGNHDVGFHDRMIYYDPLLRGRFENVFNSSLIEFKNVSGMNVINVNSMAMAGDNCNLCVLAKLRLNEISSELFKRCEDKNAIKLCEEQRPILLSHFPLFRHSDLDCNEQDSDYNRNEKVNIQPNLGCLSKRSTKFLLKKLQPRFALNGHAHYGCRKKHTIKLDSNSYQLINEYTLASFSYRYRANPSFLFVLANRNVFKITRCMIPNENYLFVIYFLTILFIVQSLFRR